MKKLTLLLLVLLFNSNPSFAQENASQENEDPIVERVKDVGEFDKIIMAGGGNVFISQSPVTMLKVVAQSSCLKSVKTEVKSQTLEIYRTSSTSNCRPDIYIGMPVLKEIQQDGGGDIKVSEGFPTIDSFHCVLNGGGSITMATLKVELFYATIKGGGTISIHANELLEADISGGGLVSYQGDPKVISNISGGGSVKQN